MHLGFIRFYINNKKLKVWYQSQGRNLLKMAHHTSLPTLKPTFFFFFFFWHGYLLSKVELNGEDIVTATWWCLFRASEEFPFPSKNITIDWNKSEKAVKVETMVSFFPLCSSQLCWPILLSHASTLSIQRTRISLLSIFMNTLVLSISFCHTLSAAPL